MGVYERTWHKATRVPRRMLMFRPMESYRRDIYAHYRDSLHLLREPDGLVIG